MLPEPEALTEPDVLPEPEPEGEPLDDEPDELPMPLELDEEELEGVRELGALRPLDVVPESDVLPEPESNRPVAAPPLGPLSFTCAWQPAKASAMNATAMTRVSILLLALPVIWPVLHSVCRSTFPAH